MVDASVKRWMLERIKHSADSDQHIVVLDELWLFQPSKQNELQKHCCRALLSK
jgi:hypothetical protein